MNEVLKYIPYSVFPCHETNMSEFALNYSMCLSDKSPSETISSTQLTGKITRLQHRNALRGKCAKGTILRLYIFKRSHSCVTSARSFAHSSMKKKKKPPSSSFIHSLCSFNELFMTMNTQILSIQTLWVNEYSHI